MTAQNYFDLFEIEESFDIDGHLLESKYFELQRKFHPDRFANSSDKERIESLHMSTFANEAYDKLKESLSRAEYILSLNDVEKIENDQSILMESMENREALAEAESLEQVTKLENECKNNIDECISALSKFFSNKDYEQANKITFRLRYLEKLLYEIGIKRKRCS